MSTINVKVKKHLHRFSNPDGSGWVSGGAIVALSPAEAKRQLKEGTVELVSEEEAELLKKITKNENVEVSALAEQITKLTRENASLRGKRDMKDENDVLKKELVELRKLVAETKSAAPEEKGKGKK